MRKSDREITDINEKLRVLDKCQTIRLGLFDGEYPYVVPLSFGWEYSDDALSIYFHCAPEGKKTELMASNERVCVEADVLNGYTEFGNGVTANYESVIAFGTAKRVSGADAVHGLELLLKHCGIKGHSPQNCVLATHVAVYKITVDNFTCKKRFVQKQTFI